MSADVAPTIAASDLLYLNGPFAPVREEVEAFDLKVVGNLPRELNGRFLRVGSNPFSVPDVSRYHWFAGTGMVHGVRLREGRALWYRNRFLLDDGLAAMRRAAPVPGIRSGHGGQAWLEKNLNNTTPIMVGGRTLAISEGGVVPIVLDDEALTTLGTEDFAGTFPGSFTGHPHLDPDSGELHVIAYCWQWDHLKYLVLNQARQLRTIAQVAAPTRPIVHDFVMTRRFAIVLDSPVVYDAGLAQQGYYGARWHDELPAEFVLIPREGISGAVRRLGVPQQAIFHFVNAYDLPDGRIVVDGVSNDRVLRDDRHGPLEGRLTMNRYTIDPLAGTVDICIVSDLQQELPRIDDRKFSKPHRYSYSWGVGEASSLIKIDFSTGRSERYCFERGAYPSEPVFQPAHQQAAEDEGWILSYIGDLRTDSSELGIFDAQDLQAGPVARIEIPQRVPVTFHGNFFADRDSSHS